jgi:hypothetical protein
MNIRYTILGIAFIACIIPANSQSDTLSNRSSFLAVGVRLHKGFIIPHSKVIKGISYSKPNIIETDISWHFVDSLSWQYCSCYPRVGLSFMYIDYDNPEILGHAYTLAPYIEPFLSANRNFSISFRFVAGVSYLDNVYDPVKNPKNFFYSTPVSFILSLDVILNYRISNRWNIRLSGYYNHISNGGNKLPNKGINFPTASLGADYLLTPVRFSYREKIENLKLTKRSSFKAGVLCTFKKPFENENKQYFLYGIYFNWSYRIARLSAIVSGIEYINDGSLKAELLRKSSPPSDHQRIALLAGHEFQIGKFIFSQQLGIYIYSPVKAKDPVYQRWGLDFHIFNKMFVGVNIKAHRHVADFMDFRFGYIL